MAVSAVRRTQRFAGSHVSLPTNAGGSVVAACHHAAMRGLAFRDSTACIGPIGEKGSCGKRSTRAKAVGVRMPILVAANALVARRGYRMHLRSFHRRRRRTLGPWRSSRTTPGRAVAFLTFRFRQPLKYCFHYSFLDCNVFHRYFNVFCRYFKVLHFLLRYFASLPLAAGGEFSRPPWSGQTDFCGRPSRRRLEVAGQWGPIFV
jgi:hypothetical protein